MKKLEKAAYHAQINGKNERYNKKIFKKMRKYVAKHQSDCYMYIQQLMYAYKNQAHSPTFVRPVELVLSRIPPNPTMKSIPTDFPKDFTTKFPTGKMQQVLLRRLAYMTAQIGEKLRKAKQRYKRYLDPKVRFTPNFRLC